MKIPTFLKHSFDIFFFLANTVVSSQKLEGAADLASGRAGSSIIFYPPKPGVFLFHYNIHIELDASY